MARLLPGLGSPSFTKVNHCSTAFGPRFTAFDRQRVDYSRAGDLAGSKFDTVTLGGVLGTGVPTISGFRYGPKGKKKNTGGDKRRVVVEVSGVTVVNEDELDPLGIPQRIINPSLNDFPPLPFGKRDVGPAVELFQVSQNKPSMFNVSARLRIPHSVKAWRHVEVLHCDRECDVEGVLSDTVEIEVLAAKRLRMDGHMIEKNRPYVRVQMMPGESAEDQTHGKRLNLRDAANTALKVKWGEKLHNKLSLKIPAAFRDERVDIENPDMLLHVQLEVWSGNNPESGDLLLDSLGIPLSDMRLRTRNGKVFTYVMNNSTLLELKISYPRTKSELLAAKANLPTNDELAAETIRLLNMGADEEARAEAIRAVIETQIVELHELEDGEETERQKLRRAERSRHVASEKVVWSQTKVKRALPASLDKEEWQRRLELAEKELVRYGKDVESISKTFKAWQWRMEELRRMNDNGQEKEDAARLKSAKLKSEGEKLELNTWRGWSRAEAEVDSQFIYVSVQSFRCLRVCHACIDANPNFTQPHYGWSRDNVKIICHTKNLKPILPGAAVKVEIWAYTNRVDTAKAAELQIMQYQGTHYWPGYDTVCTNSEMAFMRGETVIFQCGSSTGELVWDSDCAHTHVMVTLPSGTTTPTCSFDMGVVTSDCRTELELELCSPGD